MPVVAVGFQGIVKPRHLLGGFHVDLGLLLSYPLGLVAGDVGEEFYVLAEVFCLEAENLVRGAAGKPDVLEIGDKPEIGNVLRREAVHILSKLVEGLVQVLAPCLHFDSDFSFPKVVNPFSLPLDFRLFLKRAYGAGIDDAENTKKRFYEALILLFLAGGILPAVGEGYCVRLYVIPCKTQFFTSLFASLFLI